MIISSCNLHISLIIEFHGGIQMPYSLQSSLQFLFPTNDRLSFSFFVFFFNSLCILYFLHTSFYKHSLCQRWYYFVFRRLMSRQLLKIKTVLPQNAIEKFIWSNWHHSHLEAWQEQKGLLSRCLVHMADNLVLAIVRRAQTLTIGNSPQVFLSVLTIRWLQ